MSKESYCKKCNKPIKFVLTKNHKFMPVDIEPVKSNGHNYLFNEITEQFEILPAEQSGLISHFATCKFANEFRKKPANK